MKEPCKKIKYFSEENAWWNLNKINSINKTELKNVYYCDECQAYHLTRRYEKPNKQIEKLEENIKLLTENIEYLQQDLNNKHNKLVQKNNQILVLKQKHLRCKKLITSLMNKDQRFEHMKGLIDQLQQLITEEKQEQL